MSYQTLARGSAPARRGASLVPIVIAILVLGGAIWGGLYWYSNRGDAGAGGKGERTAADSAKSFLGDLEDSLSNIVKEPAKVDESVDTIKTLAETDLADLAKQATAAPADVKAKIVAMVAEYLPKLQTAIDAAYKIPGVKEKLEPLVTKLMTGLKALGV